MIKNFQVIDDLRIISESQIKLLEEDAEFYKRQHDIDFIIVRITDRYVNIRVEQGPARSPKTKKELINLTETMFRMLGKDIFVTVKQTQAQCL